VNDFNSPYEIEGDRQTGHQRPVTLFYAVTGGYREAMQIPLLQGRFITDADRRGGHRVVVINERSPGCTSKEWIRSTIGCESDRETDSNGGRSSGSSAP